MERRVCPVEMLAVCGTEGQLVPLRFRIEDENQVLQTVRVSEVVSTKENRQVGIESLHYVCKVEMGGREQLAELRYALRTHRWVLFPSGCHTPVI